MALQEIKPTSRAENAWTTVTQSLCDRVGGNWKVALNSCGSGTSQHVGFLWNADKYELEDDRQLWQLNGASTGPGEPCEGNLRPGYGGFFKPTSPDGFDFYAASVHFDSGRSKKDFDTRQAAYDNLDAVAAIAADSETDVIILGDYNTMGREYTGVSGKEEIQKLKTKAISEAPGFTLLEATPACTEYFEKKGGWLDHIVVTSGTEEVLANAEVTGYCAVNACAPISGEMPAAYRILSDHCPIVADFRDRDLDT